MVGDARVAVFSRVKSRELEADDYERVKCIEGINIISAIDEPIS